MTNKTVKIDLQTFIKLMRYFTLDDHSNELYEEIKRDIDSKADKLYRHELYSQSKTAESEQKREQARQKYLDEIGMRDSFRY